ncbi:helix-turn-helix domain-containing protein [Bifidobacterium dentium]|uniref:helix-turn-helix domain-containing protein n=1 Tax=Bifidobacterium dentium TaxID=1689 RepID=UPI0018B0569F|nr:helix-turn-helix transcriptional regulator [Bifidobacterium dentium]MBF9694081.1 helix-turn-helix transcriptional regulator [Bifidobacterium dentium]
MATGKKIPTIESKALSIAIKRAMATREIKGPALAEKSGVPYSTLRKIFDLNTVADYEQLQRIANALRMPLSQIITDADKLSEDPDIIGEFEASQEEIDFDAWAERIKAEESAKTR